MIPYFLSILLFIAVPAYAATELERSILQELNVARTQPEVYIRYLEDYRRLFKDKIYTRPESNIRIRTQEGIAPIDEAITFLHGRSPLPPLRWSDGLARAGAELVRAQAKNKETGHGSGRMAMAARIERHVRWTGTIGEAIAYGPKHGRDVVVQLLVDDGVPDRGHRKALLHKDYRLAGVSCAPHPTYEIACVIDFAAGEEGT